MPTLLPFPAGTDRAAIATDAETPFAMNLVLAYENLSAALWATERLSGVLRSISQGGIPHLSPWSFSTLENPELREQATAAGFQADLLVVATSSVTQRLPAAVENWLGKCLSGRRSPATAVIAFLGCANLLDQADSPRLQTMRQLTEDAGCQFFSPSVTEATPSAA